MSWRGQGTKRHSVHQLWVLLNRWAFLGDPAGSPEVPAGGVLAEGRVEGLGGKGRGEGRLGASGQSVGTETGKGSWWLGCNLKFCHFFLISLSEGNLTRECELILIEVTFSLCFLSVKSSLFC